MCVQHNTVYFISCFATVFIISFHIYYIHPSHRCYTVKSLAAICSSIISTMFSEHCFRQTGKKTNKEERLFRPISKYKLSASWATYITALPSSDRKTGVIGGKDDIHYWSELLGTPIMIFLYIWWDNSLLFRISEDLRLWLFIPLESKPFHRLKVSRIFLQFTTDGPPCNVLIAVHYKILKNLKYWQHKTLFIRDLNCFRDQTSLLNEFQAFWNLQIKLKSVRH